MRPTLSFYVLHALALLGWRHLGGVRRMCEGREVLAVDAAALPTVLSLLLYLQYCRTLAAAMLL